MSIHSATLIAGRYRLLRLLGRGGMSEVWLARDEHLDRDVAVKTCRGATDPAPGFSREAGILSTLRHPNIVNVYDAGEREGQPFLVMEYVAGESLRDRIRRGPMPLDEAVSALAAIGEALAHAHSRGILHNDVKPENILFDEAGQPRLSDFGIASTAPGTAAPHDLMGTVAYVAPEVLQGLPPTAASDVYALATTLYEALTGRLPFSADSTGTIAARKLNERAPAVSEVLDGVPAALAALIDASLSPIPAQRPTPAQFAAELRSLGPRDAARAPTTSLAALLIGRGNHRTEPIRRVGPERRARRGWLVAGGVAGVLAALAGVVALSGSDPGPEEDNARLNAVTPLPSPTPAATQQLAPAATAEPSGDREDPDAGPRNEDDRGNDDDDDDDDDDDGNRGRGNGNGRDNSRRGRGR